MSTTSTARPLPAAPPLAPPRPWWTLSGLLERLLALAVLLISGLLLSIFIEWVGMIFVWPTEGAGHSERMLAAELAFLDQDFQQPVPPLSVRPATLAEQSAALVYRYSGLEAVLGWLTAPPAVSSSSTLPFMAALEPLLQSLRFHAAVFADFFIAAATIAQVYGVRLAVVALSLPAFLLFALVALVDGLVQRDLRRFGGGIESAFIYHRLKPLLKPLLALPILIYLTSPVTLHPTAVFLPAALLFAVLLAKTVARFKKFL